MGFFENAKKTYRVTELNTRVVKHKGIIEDILYGDDCKSYEFETESEALDKVNELEEKGIITNLNILLKM